MPLQHSPPSKETAATDTDAKAQQGNEEHSDNSSSYKQPLTEPEKVTKRNKRRRKYSDDGTTGKKPETNESDFASFCAEIRSLIAASNSQQDKKFTLLQSSVNGIKDQNNEIQKSIEFISLQYEEMKNKLEALEAERKHNISYIKSLEDRLDSMERNTRSSSIEIRNVPMKTNETKEDLTSVIKNIGTALNVKIETSDIRDVFRIPTKAETNKPVIVEFTRVPLKENIISSVKIFNKKDNSNKLNTSHLQIIGAPVPIYISENLTTKNKKLYFHAREFAKKNDFRFCWTSRGKIFLRKKEGSSLVRIDSEADLVESNDSK